MKGGSLNPAYIAVSQSHFLLCIISRVSLIPVANYLLKSVQGFHNKGIPVYAISIQVRSFRRKAMNETDGAQRMNLRTVIRHTQHVLCQCRPRVQSASPCGQCWMEMGLAA